MVNKLDTITCKLILSITGGPPSFQVIQVARHLFYTFKRILSESIIFGRAKILITLTVMDTSFVFTHLGSV